MPGTANATFCATLFDEWIRRGLRHVVASPGSRSTPLVLAAADRAEVGDLELHLVHDERAAAFIALGIGAASAVPAALVCTSGTAGANYLPAVVEAGLSAVPLIVATADRPPELRGVGSPQTIDQLELYGGHVRWFFDAPPPGESNGSDGSDIGEDWRAIAADAFAAAQHGPAHLNCPFREPLVGTPGELPAPIDRAESPDSDPSADSTAVSPVEWAPNEIPVDLHGVQRGVIVAGGRSGVPVATITQLAHRLGWPILADPLVDPMIAIRSDEAAVDMFDGILRAEEFARAHAPELVVRFGRPPSSKVLSQWVVGTGAPVVQVGGPGIINPDHNVVAACAAADADAFTAVLRGAADTPWLARWRYAAQRADTAVDNALINDLSEPAVARRVANTLGESAVLVVASSMPIRDLEWYGGPRARAFANRGANGIDGVLSTAVGWALTGLPTTVLIGDLAFIHDSNALVALNGRAVTMNIVVVDNDGGAIFSFLPQAAALDPTRFERLFGTPTGTDVLALASAHGLTAVDVADLEQLDAALVPDGVRVIRVRSDRVANVDVHRRLNDRITAAVERR